MNKIDKTNLTLVIDKIENGISVCECLETGERIEIPINSLPADAKESDIIREDKKNTESGKSIYVIDVALTKDRLAEMTDRMNRLFAR